MPSTARGPKKDTHMSVSVRPGLFLEKSYHQGWTTELWDELSWHKNITGISVFRVAGHIRAQHSVPWAPLLILMGYREYWTRAPPLNFSVFSMVLRIKPKAFSHVS